MSLPLFSLDRVVAQFAKIISQTNMEQPEKHLFSCQLWQVLKKTAS
jgi:hypothetical protein